MIYCKECNKIYLHYKRFRDIKGLLVDDVWCDKGIIKNNKNDCYLDITMSKVIDYSVDRVDSEEYECPINDDHFVKKIKTDFYRREDDIDYILSLNNNYEIDLSKLSVEQAYKLREIIGEDL